MSKPWCKHLDRAGEIFNDSWLFCPVCGSSRPPDSLKDKIMKFMLGIEIVMHSSRYDELMEIIEGHKNIKSLEEKFNKFLQDKGYESRMTCAKELAEIAKAHFQEKEL